MNKTLKAVLDVAWYLVLFLIIQIVAVAAVTLLAKSLLDNDGPTTLVAGYILSSVITLFVFFRCKYTPLRRDFLKSRPFAIIFWTCTLALGIILPTEWIYEQVNLQMPEDVEAMFDNMMKTPYGYLAIGILAPLAEETVMRGAILRKLLETFRVRNPRGGTWSTAWLPIIISALLFAIVHGNLAQGIHGFIVGLLLGWLYWKTGSIFPGVVLHWVNNSVAYALFKLMPSMDDGKLIDLFHGDERMMMGGLAFSMLICLPSLYQLYIRTRRGQ